MLVLAQIAACALLAPPLSSPPNLYGTWLGPEGEVVQVRGTSAVVVLDDRVLVGRLGDAAKNGNRLTSLSATPRHVAVGRTTSAWLRRLDDGVEVCINGTQRCVQLRPTPGAGVGPEGPQGCVARCIERTQMRAVSAEQVESDCVRSCAAAQP